MDFKHGGDVYSAQEAWGVEMDRIRDFSANINPFGFNQDLFLETAKDMQMVSHYPDPDYRKLRNALGDHYAIDPTSIIVGNGGIELIYRALQAVKPRRVGILAPTFIEYERAAMSLDCEIRVLQTNQYDFRPSANGIIEFASTVDALFICNPNNPTAVLYTREELIHIIESCSQTVFLIDEAFMDFVEEKQAYTLLDQMDRFNNVIVIRSMTKMYSMPGLRLGFLCTGNKDLQNKIAFVLNPWNVNSLVSEYMSTLLKEDFEPFNPKILSQLRQDLINGISPLPGIKVYPSDVNYVFFRYEGSIDWVKSLGAYHILIRDCSNYRGLKNGDFRIAVKEADDNHYLIQAMHTILKEQME